MYIYLYKCFPPRKATMAMVIAQGPSFCVRINLCCLLRSFMSLENMRRHMTYSKEANCFVREHFFLLPVAFSQRISVIPF